MSIKQAFIRRRLSPRQPVSPPASEISISLPPLSLPLSLSPSLPLSLFHLRSTSAPPVSSSLPLYLDSPRWLRKPRYSDRSAAGLVPLLLSPSTRSPLDFFLEQHRFRLSLHANDKNKTNKKSSWV